MLAKLYRRLEIALYVIAALFLFIGVRGEFNRSAFVGHETGTSEAAWMGAGVAFIALARTFRKPPQP